MLFQITLLVLVACASANPTSYASDAGYQSYQPKPQAEPEPEVNIDYKMSMAVHDDKTYNYQTREESKEGKVVRGSYTVLEPTGELRVVKYVADENGFQADVQNQQKSAPLQDKPVNYYPSKPVPVPVGRLAPARQQAPVKFVLVAPQPVPSDEGNYYHEEKNDKPAY